MLYLILGLVIFIGIHLVRMVAPQWREAKIVAMGEGKWKGLYSLVSFASLGLIVWGYSIARPAAQQIFTPPTWAPHLVMLLMAIAFILMMAGNLPTGRIKQAVKHPFIASIKIWSFAHLLANGDMASLVLFGTFLVYSVWNRISLKRRGAPDPIANSSSSDLIAIASGLLIWGIFVYWAHEWLFGVNPIA